MKFMQEITKGFNETYYEPCTEKTRLEAASPFFVGGGETLFLPVKMIQKALYKTLVGSNTSPGDLSYACQWTTFHFVVHSILNSKEQLEVKQSESNQQSQVLQLYVAFAYDIATQVDQPMTEKSIPRSLFMHIVWQ